MSKQLVECVMQGDKAIPIVKMYESYTGWYWFITEIDKQDPNYMFGLVVGFESEWGYVDKRELDEQGLYSVWEVPRKNWSSNSHIKMVKA